MTEILNVENITDYINKLEVVNAKQECSICMDLCCHDELTCGNPKCDKKYCLNCYNKLKTGIKYATYTDEHHHINLVCPYCRVNSFKGVFSFKDKDLIIENAKHDYSKYFRDEYKNRNDIENLKLIEKKIYDIDDIIQSTNTVEDKAKKYIKILEDEVSQKNTKYEELQNKFLELEKNYTEMKLINRNIKLEFENKNSLLQLQHYIINTINDNVNNIINKNKKSKTIKKKELSDVLKYNATITLKLK